MVDVIRIDPDCKYIVKVPSVSDIAQRRCFRILEEWWKERGSPFLVIGGDVELVRADFDAVEDWIVQLEKELEPAAKGHMGYTAQWYMDKLAGLRKIIGAPRGLLSKTDIENAWRAEEADDDETNL